MSRREGELITNVLGVLMLLSIFGYAIYVKSTPRVEVLEIRVFDYQVSKDGEYTIIYPYDYGGTLEFHGSYDFEIDRVYRLTLEVRLGRSKLMGGWGKARLLGVEPVG
jgi:hypothetical protein